MTVGLLFSFLVFALTLLSSDSFRAALQSTGQNKVWAQTKQNKTKQSKAKQSKRSLCVFSLCAEQTNLKAVAVAGCDESERQSTHRAGHSRDCHQKR